jgi:Holliday junction resolvase
VAITPERKVKQNVVTVLKEHGAYHFFPAANGLGRSGIPDIIVCHRGLFLAIECKAGKGKTTALQERELARIRTANGVALTINETNRDLVRLVLTSITERANETIRENTEVASAARGACVTGED